MFVLFLALIIGPIVAAKFIKINLSLPMQLLQPTGQKNNDTTNIITGSCINGPCPGAVDATGAAASGSAAATSASASFSNFGKLRY